MEKSKRKNIRLKEYDYSQAGAYFITVCTLDRKPLLSKIAVGTPVPGCPQVPFTELLPFGKIADQTIRKMAAFYKNLSVDKYCIMPDHVHFLLTILRENGHPGRGVPTRSSEIARFVGTFKRFCNKEYGQNIWQSRYYDHIVRNSQDYNEIWEYIDNNPRSWALLRHMV